MAVRLSDIPTGPQRLSDIPMAEQGGLGEVVSRPLTQQERETGITDEFLRGQLQSGAITQDKSLLDTIREEIPQTTGGIAGSIATVRALQPRLASLPPKQRALATLAVGTAGAFGGGALGKAGQDIYKDVFTGESLTRGEILERATLAGVEEAAGEVLGFGAGKLVGKAGRALKGLIKLKPGAKAAAAIAREGGTVATKGQLLENRLSGMFEGFAEKFTFGGGKLRLTKGVAQQEAIQSVGNRIQKDFATNLGRQLTPTQAGNVVFDALNQASDYFNAASKAMYKQVDKEIKKAGIKNTALVDMRPLKRFAQSRLSKLGPKVGESVPSINLAQKITDIPDFMTFGGSASLRSGLFKEEAEAAAIGGSKAAVGMAKQLRKMTHQQIEKSGKALPKIKGVIDQWSNANAFFRTGKEKFNRSIVKQLGKTLENEPQKLVDILFKEEGVTGVLRTKQLLSMKQGLGIKTWKSVKEALVRDIFKEAGVETAEGLQTFSGKKISSQLSKLGDDVLRATFKPDELASLRSFAEGASALQRKLRPVPGGIAVPLAQVGSVGAAFKGNLAPVVAITSVPKLMSIISLNKRWTDIALDVAKPDPNPASVVKFVNMLRRIDNQEKAKRRRQDKKRSEPIAPGVL